MTRFDRYAQYAQDVEVILLTPGCRATLKHWAGYEPHPVVFPFGQPVLCERYVCLSNQ